MPIYRVTFGFEGQGQGWSETHAQRSSLSAPADLASQAIAVAQKRAAFLGTEFAINAIRISRYSDDGGTQRQKGVYLIKRRFENPVTDGSQSAEPAVVALLARCSTDAAGAPAGFEANTARTFLGAPPDQAVDFGGTVLPGNANLGANFTQWALLLRSYAYGWLGSATVANVDLDSIQQNANGTVNIQSVQANPAGLTSGTSYNARIRRVNGGVSPMNGPVIVKFTSPVDFDTQEVIGLGLAQEGGAMRIYKKIAPFIPYVTIELDLITAKHQRGRPFGSSPGRARKRVRG
jgi:hypothetical protein